MQKIICFHNPEEENGWLSNWYLSRFTVDGITFSSMEQYMMYMKAEVFGDGIKMFLLSQGSWVRVLDPPEFVEEFKAEISKMTKMYE